MWESRGSARRGRAGSGRQPRRERARKSVSSSSSRPLQLLPVVAQVLPELSCGRCRWSPTGAGQGRARSRSTASAWARARTGAVARARPVVCRAGTRAPGSRRLRDGGGGAAAETKPESSGPCACGSVARLHRDPEDAGRVRKTGTQAPGWLGWQSVRLSTSGCEVTKNKILRGKRELKMRKKM